MSMLPNGMWVDEVTYKDKGRAEYLWKFSDRRWLFWMRGADNEFINLVNDSSRKDLPDIFNYEEEDYTLLVPEEML